MEYRFTAKIYQTGINWAVDVPVQIMHYMLPDSGYIRIKGEINGFCFIQTLVPVKNAPYRLFVNLIMMKGGKTEVNQTAHFVISPNLEQPNKIYPVHKLLGEALEKQELKSQFEALTLAKQKDILKYLNGLKTEVAIQKNVNKVIAQLKGKEKTVKIP